MRWFLILPAVLLFLFPPATAGLSIYEVLENNGLPMGLLPEGVRNFSYGNSTGKFEVHLDRACNAKFETELRYDTNISGTIRYGRIDDLLGISAQDLFLWFPVIEIRVDVPSSGLIYFNVGVILKQFSLSSFENPRDCVAIPDQQGPLVRALFKVLLGKIGYELNPDNAAVI